ncbi:MAG: CHAT domain-containing protein [Chitinophagales bacterium]
MNIEQNEHQDALLSKLQVSAEEEFLRAYRLHESEKFQDSIKSAESAIKLYEQLGNQDKIFSLRKVVAANYLVENSIETASNYLEDFLESTLCIFGENHPNVAEVYNQLGYLYSVILKDIEKGIMYDEKCLEIRLKVDGENKATIAYSYNNLGYSYGEIEDYHRQFLYYQKALNLRKEIYQKPHDDIAESYNNLGFYHQNVLQDYKTALPYLQKALDIRKEILGEFHHWTALAYGNVGGCYKESGKIEKGLAYQKKALSIYERVFDKPQHLKGDAFVTISCYYLELKEWKLAIQSLEKAWKIFDELYKGKNRAKAETLKTWAQVLLKQSKIEEALTKIQEALEQELNKEVEPKQSGYKVKDFKETSNLLIEILKYKAEIHTAYYENISKDKKDLSCALESYLLAIHIIETKRRNYKTEKSKLLLKDAISVYGDGLQLAYRIGVETSAVKMKEVSFSFAEKAKAALLLSILNDAAAKLKVQLPVILLEKERRLKSRLTFLDKSIQGYKEKQESSKEGEGGLKQNQLKKWQNEFFDFHQEYLQLLEQLETDYPDYYQLKYDTKTVIPSELQSTLQENQVVLSYFVGKDKLYIFVVTPDDFEVIDLQLPEDFEALIEGFMAALTQHQFAAFIEKSHQLHQLLIAPIRDFIVDDFGFDDELKQVFVIPHGVLSYVPFEALIEQPLSRFPTVDKVVKTLSTVEELDNSLNDNSWGNLGYLIHHCQVSYHYSTTLLYRHLLKKQKETEFPNSFAGFAPIYDISTPSKSITSSLTESEQAYLLQQSAKSMQSWVTRSEAIRSDGTWVSLPHSETEAKGIAQLFEEKGLKSKTFLREKASKEGFAEAANRFKFLLVAAHGLVNDEKTALSGLVFYPNSSEPLSRSLTVDKVLTREVETLSTAESLDNSWNDGESTTDSILSMEETHHLDLQADLVVLSSCESGIGTLHKGEGMMAVNRGFLAAGANNVVSTLFKVYDKPSSLLTQYLFEEVLEGKTYSAALRLAKLKLMQQPNIDPKSWSGFVLIGG